MARSVRVLLADEYELVRHGVRLILEEESTIQVVGEARNAEEATIVAPRLDPDVVVVDVDRLSVLHKLKERCPRARILVLTHCADPAFAEGALAAGAGAYLLKQGTSARLIRAVQALGRGDDATPIVDPQIELRSRRADHASDLLSERERQILALVAAGHTSKGIARKLQLSPRTVGNHRARIMAKLRVENCVQAAAHALQLGLIAPHATRAPASEPRVAVWSVPVTAATTLAAAG
jgi:DNA-binding NarL/FixJ family response regulator